MTVAVRFPIHPGFGSLFASLFNGKVPVVDSAYYIPRFQVLLRLVETGRLNKCFCLNLENACDVVCQSSRVGWLNISTTGTRMIHPGAYYN